MDDTTQHVGIFDRKFEYKKKKNAQMEEVVFIPNTFSVNYHIKHKAYINQRSFLHFG